MRLLLTRPEPDGARSAARLRALGHEVILAPLMRIEPVAADIEGPFAAALITSANAARAAVAHPRSGELKMLPLFAVGDRSAEAARAAGFADVVSAEGALGDLVRLAASRFGRGARLLYFAGEDRAGDLAGELAAHGLSVSTAVIYRAAAAGALGNDVVQALGAGRIDAALHYSRRSVVTLLRLAGEAGVLNAVLSLAHYCLSDEVAAPLREAGGGRITVALHPDEAALIDLF